MLELRKLVVTVLFIFILQLVTAIGASASNMIDVTLLIDTTGSMTGTINGVKASAASIVSYIASKVPDYRVALADFKDYPQYPYGESSDYTYRSDVPFTTSLAAFNAGLNTLYAAGGWDTPESTFTAAIKAINNEGLGVCRPGAIKVLIYFTDAPPHVPREPYPPYYTIDNVIAAALSQPCPTKICPMLETTDSTAVAVANTLADSTGGKAYVNLTPSQIIDAVNGCIDVAIGLNANAGGPYTSRPGEPINFSADKSSSVNDTIVKYEWDWNNDGTYDVSSTSPYITHIMTPAPTLTTTYTVGLRITGASGMTATATAKVTVVNSPPVAKLDGPYVWFTGYPLSFNAGASTDPDGDSIVKYEWDWNNDGVYDQATTTPIITHIYPSLYLGNVGLRVTDKYAATGTTTTQVAVIKYASAIGNGTLQNGDFFRTSVKVAYNVTTPVTGKIEYYVKGGPSFISINPANYLVSIDEAGKTLTFSGDGLLNNVACKFSFKITEKNTVNAVSITVTDLKGNVLLNKSAPAGSIAGYTQLIIL